MSKIKKINELLTTKQISCSELTQKYLESIEKENAALNAYITVTADAAMAAAKKVDEKIQNGETLSPLAGIPMTLKDNISTKGIKTTCASKMLADYVPVYDAAVWEMLRDQGAILLGKTNMDEFAMGSTGETSYFGAVKNPHNADRTPGGSTSGGAAAVAGNLAAFALGSDAGGSVRVPASFCGVVGLKPTYGSVSRYGIAATTSSFDMTGPITSCVEDAALVLDAISAKDHRDSVSVGCAPTAASLGNSLKGTKVGVLKELFENVSEDVAAAMDQAIQVYKDLGAEIVELSMPELKYCMPVYEILGSAEISSNFGRYDGIRYGYKVATYNDLNEMICKTRSEGFGAEVKRRIMVGTYTLSSGHWDTYFGKATAVRGVIVQAFNNVFQNCDILISPTAPMTAFAAGNTAKTVAENCLTDIFTVPANVAGLPAISVPCGLDRDGMPIGLQVMGKKFEEATILNAAYQFEHATRAQAFKALEMGVTL